MNRTTTPTTGRKKIVVDCFDSVGDFVGYCTDPKNTVRKGLSVASDNTGRDDFFWTSTFDEAVTLSRVGWPEGTAKVTKYRNALDSFVTAAATAKSRQFGFDVTGDYIDVGRYLSGEPEVFGTEFEDGDSIRGKVVSIRLNASVSGSVSADTICARGVTALVAVDLLESLGVRCEVVVASGSRSSDWGGCGNDPTIERYDFNVVVKQAGEPVDPDRLAFAVAHPSFFRRFGFRCEELGGYSPSGACPAPLTDYGKKPGVIEIDEILSGAALKPDQVKRNVLKIASKCGIEFTDEQARELIGSASR